MNSEYGIYLNSKARDEQKSFIGRKVKHKSLGTGTIISISGDNMRIDYGSNGVKIVRYSTAFSGTVLELIKE